MMKWESIFPTPILRSNIGRKVTADELRYFEAARAAAQPNVANFRSIDTRVLDAPQLQSLRAVIADHINQFAWKVISAHPRHEFYITQSWLNFTEKGQYHHRHIHTNSLISGTLYIQVKKEVDSICFYRHNLSQLTVTDEQINDYNAPAQCFAVDVGDLILFPSNLVHDVRQANGDHTRISLAFNAFIRGELGSENKLNQLVIQA